MYLRMGGRTDDVVIRLLDDSADLPRILSMFDAGKARCYLASDRHRLLAVIESAFGTFGPFNKIVRGVFTEKIELKTKKWQRADQVAPHAPPYEQTPVIHVMEGEDLEEPSSIEPLA